MRSLSINTVVLLLILSGAAWAQPSISFEGSLGTPSTFSGGSGGTLPYEPPYTFSSTLRHLGEKRSEIIKSEYFSGPNTLGFYEKKVTRIQKLDILDITAYQDHEGQKGSLIHNAKYILGAKNLAEGYCLLDTMRIEDFMDHPFVTSIQALPENSNYLADKLVYPDPNLVRLHFYEKVDAKFVERYGIIYFYSPVHKRMLHLLVLDAYYPKSLESTFAEDIAAYINFELERYTYFALLESGL